MAESVTETIRKTVEIVRFGDYDIVLNPGYADQEGARELLKTVKNGIPGTWIPYPTCETDEERIEEGRAQEVNTVVDSESDPRFFAKRRVNIDRYGTGKAIANVPRSEGEILRQLHKRKGNAFNSIVSEFALTPKIVSTLESERATNIVSAYGFSSVRFITPILGLIQRSTGEKIIIYDYMAADDWYASRAKGTSKNRIQLLDEHGRLESLADELVGLFKDNGIFPGDLGEHQLMSARDLGGHYVLYLVDSEGYFSDAEGKFKDLPAMGV